MTQDNNNAGGGLNRRNFLGTTGAIAATTVWSAKSYAAVVGANERIHVGFIGVGGMGSGHLGAIVRLKEKNNLQPIAVADCWKTRAEDGAKKVGESAKNLQILSTQFHELVARFTV